jgi:hypothetical protein
VTAKAKYGTINIDTTGEDYPMLAGNVVSLGASTIIAVVWSLLFPDNFDFNITRTKLEQLTDDEIDENAIYHDPIEMDEVALKKASKFAVWSSGILTLILIIIWPLPMYFSKYVFSKPFFSFWVAISIIWVFYGTLACALYPVSDRARPLAFHPIADCCSVASHCGVIERPTFLTFLGPIPPLLYYVRAAVGVALFVQNRISRAVWKGTATGRNQKDCDRRER